MKLGAALSFTDSHSSAVKVSIEPADATQLPWVTPCVRNLGREFSMTQHRFQFVTLAVAAALLAAGSAWASLVTISDTCIPKGSCISIPVDITRGGGEPSMRGFSINFTIDPAKLTLCGTSPSVIEGGYLKAANPSTTFFVTPNGGGSYTVDCVINGSPCGASAPSGTLFYIQVTNVGGVGGVNTTTTIPVSTVSLADCVAGPIPFTNGPAAAVTIDDTPCVPVPVELSGFTIE